MNVKAIRRTNLRQLAKEVGGINQLANKLDKTQSQISHLIGIKPIKAIGHKVAADVEKAFHKPAGWLDRIQSLEVEEEIHQDLSDRDRGILCSQVPLIGWQDIPAYLTLQKDLPDRMEWVVSYVKLSALGFAVRIYGDSMESSSGMSFSEGQLILVEPQQKAKPGDFVIVQIQPDRGATLKQFTHEGGEKYLRPLNRRYPCLHYTTHTQIWGVVRQLVVDF